MRPFLECCEGIVGSIVRQLLEVCEEIVGALWECCEGFGLSCRCCMSAYQMWMAERWCNRWRTTCRCWRAMWMMLSKQLRCLELHTRYVTSQNPHKPFINLFITMHCLVHQEARVSHAVEMMSVHVEHLKSRYTTESGELLEARKLLHRRRGRLHSDSTGQCCPLVAWRTSHPSVQINM